MLDDNYFENLKKFAMHHFENSSGHGFDHVQRVYNNSLNISKEEDVDMDIVRAAALLHDVARLKEQLGKADCHAAEGSIMARKILDELDFPKEKIDAVCYAIRVHRYSGGVIPETFEAKILQDADRLDALGATCIGRVLEYGGKKGRPIYNPNEDLEAKYVSGGNHSAIAQFHRKTLKLTPNKFHTKKAQEIASGRYKFVKEFVERYVKEINGEL